MNPEQICALRPRANKKMAQCHIDTQSLTRRVNYIGSRIDRGRILFIGDDDFASVALMAASPKLDFSLIEIDERVISCIRDQFSRKGMNIKVYRYDLRNAYLDRWPTAERQFDFFVTDPPYTPDGMKAFIYAGIMSLVKGGLGFIAVPYEEGKKHTIDLFDEVAGFIKGCGCEIVAVEHHFHRYVNGVFSSMVLIQKKSETVPDIGPLKHPKSFYPRKYGCEDDY